MMNRYQYINLDYINEMADGDRAFLVEMINDYIRTIPAYIEDLSQASGSGNREDIGFFAHKLASSFQMMGAKQLNDIALWIQQRIKSGLHIEELPSQMEKMHELFGNVVNELQHELHQLTASN
jgi:HPt (histidine-containing phosphotransfer) domain-containing protein